VEHGVLGLGVEDPVFGLGQGLPTSTRPREA
jgi:hypothetical protein